MAGGIVQKLRKRKCYPVTIGEETIHVRPLTLGELSQLDGLQGARQIAGFYFGCSLVDDSGEPAFKRVEGETLDAFAERVANDLQDIPQDTLHLIRQAIEKASNVPSLESLKKS